MEKETFVASTINQIKEISSKAISCSLLGGLVGCSRGYLNGESLLARTYIAFGTTLVFSSSFFGVAQLCNVTRGSDDIYNYALSGLINGCAFSALRKKNLMFGSVVGTCIGGVYKAGGGWLFENSRSQWLEHRKYQLQNTHERKLVVTKPSFSPIRQEYDFSNFMKSSSSNKKDD